jgi:hypothetical protein
MMKKSALLLSFLILSVLAMAQQAKKMDTQQLFERGFFMETVERNLDGAIEVYEVVVALKPQDRHLLARTYYQLAECWEKKGDKINAAEIYRELLRMFPDEKELVQNAKNHLSEQMSRNAPEHMAKILETNLTVDFADSPVAELFVFLRNRLGINIVLTSAYQTSTPQISISVSELKVSSLLRIVMDMTQGEFAFLHDALIVGKKQEIAEIRRREWSDTGNMPVGTQALEQTLKSTQCTLDLADVPVHQIIAFCRKTFNINMVVHPDVNARQISLHLTDISCLNALRLICIAHGDLAYGYKNDVVFLTSWSQYKKMVEESEKIFVPLVFRITYDVPPPQGYPACKAVFTAGDGTIRIMDVSPESQFRIVAGAYKLNFDLPGYFYGKPKDINIEKSFTLFSVEEKLLAAHRALSFELEDTSTGKLVTAEKILVNGKMVTFKDTFKPGTTLDVTIECKGYAAYQGKIALEPGKGPFVIKVSLQKTKDTEEGK